MTNNTKFVVPLMRSTDRVSVRKAHDSLVTISATTPLLEADKNESEKGYSCLKRKIHRLNQTAMWLWILLKKALQTANLS